MTLNVKEIIWRKIYLKKDVSKDDVIRWLENNPIQDIYDSDLYDEENELMIDTTEPMSIEDNLNCSTIELFDEKGEHVIWENRYA